jgi:hypothetical protein
MTDQLDQYRFEVKFVCPVEFRDHFALWLRSAPVGFHHGYEDRIVNNVYFDTLDLRDFSDNVTGLSNRLKTRLRWYGDHTAPAAMTLEHKIKRGRVNRKLALPLPGLDLANTTWRELAGYLCAHAEHRSCVVASNFMNPLLRNRYRRSYYVTRGRRVRMTVDSDLTFYDPATTSIMAGGRGLRMNYDIVEFKTGIDRAEELHRLLRHIPIRVSRFSKYVVGVDQLRLRGDATVRDHARELRDLGGK